MDQNVYRLLTASSHLLDMYACDGDGTDQCKNGWTILTNGLVDKVTVVLSCHDKVLEPGHLYYKLDRFFIHELKVHFQNESWIGVTILILYVLSFD